MRKLNSVRFRAWFYLFTAFAAMVGAPVCSETLMRFPSSSVSELAFVAHGDLWTAPRHGGTAQRIVKSAGHIDAARFSPNGHWIAYTERTHGGQDVFVVAPNGGVPRRLTFDARVSASANLVIGWTPDSRKVLFLSDRKAIAVGQLQAFSVSIDGGMAQRLPLAQSGSLAYAPDGRSIAYTPTFTDLSSRKRYIGGQAEDIFLYDPVSHNQSRITDWKGTDTAPMWSGRRIYFLSDRGPSFRLNLWRYGLDSHATTQITHFADFDIDSPTLVAGRITFQQGGKLWAINLPDETLKPIQVNVPDDGSKTAPRTMTAARDIRAKDVTSAPNYAIAPDGKAAFFAAHGDLFRMPLDGGTAQALTATQGTDEDHPATSPDGTLIAYITEDESAQQVAVRPATGGVERRLTTFATGVFYAPIFSPDERSLIVPSAEHDLWRVPLTGGATQLVAHDPIAEIRDATFSADGRWLAYSTTRASGQKALHLRENASGRDVVISSNLESDRLPAFSFDGKTLFFVSQRHERPFTSDRGDEATLSTLNSDGIYGVSLANAASDPEAIMRSAVALPVPAGRIVSLQVRNGTLFYEARPPDLLSGEDPDQAATLDAFEIGSGHTRVVLRGFDNAIVAADGRTVLSQHDGTWRVSNVDARDDGHTVDLAGLTVTVDPRAEWREMFEHVWRLDRDLFFSRVMNGSDWQAVHDAYAKLIPLTGSRDDMFYLLRQLQGEIATSHTFIDGLDAGDIGPPNNTPMLGADLQADQRSGRYRVVHVYAGDPTRPRFRSPLNAPALDGPGVHVTAGDYILAIDDVDLRTPTDPDSLLAGKQGTIALTVASKPSGPGHEVRITPVSEDIDLRQHDWVETNRARVAKLSDGRIGYIFVADFSAKGSQDLVRQLQSQLDKDGLIIDVRWNRGGYTSQAVLNILRRVRAGTFVNREGAVSPLPLFVAPRAMAVVTNAESASDGDQFPYFFRIFGLGPVVGQRTWGGVQGINGDFSLIDGTEITIPKDSLASTDGHWLIENAGVVPDIAVDPALDEGQTGKDRQLETAVRVVMAKLAASPPSSLKAPAPLPAYPSLGNVPGATFGNRK